MGGDEHRAPTRGADRSVGISPQVAQVILYEPSCPLQELQGQCGWLGSRGCGICHGVSRAAQEQLGAGRWRGEPGGGTSWGIRGCDSPQGRAPGGSAPLGQGLGLGVAGP